MAEYEKPRERLINFGVEHLSNEELKEILKELAPSDAEANNLIMKAREHWFDAEK